MKQFTRVSIKQLARTALVLLPLASLALAQPPRMAALSDLQEQGRGGGSVCPKPDLLGVNYSAQADTDLQTQAGLGQSLSDGIGELIIGLEEQLRELPKDDPSRAQLEKQLEQFRAQQRQVPQILPLAPQSAALTLPSTLAKLRRALGLVSGPGSVRLIEGAPEYREAGNASRTAALAAVIGKPQLGLGLLLRAQALEPRNPAHLVNLGGLANYYGLFAEALTLITAADRLSPPAALRPLLLNNKGHALLRLRRLSEAETALRAAAQADPNLQEARVNLAFALGAQNKCVEAKVWAHRAVWRHNLSGAENVQTTRARPLAEAFTVSAAAPALPSLTLIAPDQTADALNGLSKQLQQVTAKQPTLNEMSSAFAVRSRRSVEIGSERRVGHIKAKFVDLLADAQNTATRLSDGNDYAPAQGRALEAAEVALKRRMEELGARFFSSPSCANATAWREAALPSFQAVDSALRAVYAVAWRSSATLTSRFSEIPYRNVAVLNLRTLYYTAVGEIHANAQTYLISLSVASGYAVCGAGSTPMIGALATPQIPAACTPSAAPAIPAKGWRLALSCDRTDFNFANPTWMNRFQILRDSDSPLVESQLDSRLTVLVPGGFVRLTKEAAVMDAGLTAPGGNRNWSFVWNASAGGAGLASSESESGLK